MPTLSNREISQRAAALRELLSPCELCPRRCGIDRLSGATGFCGLSDRSVVASVLPHHGEEPPISGTSGSGTIFFSSCNAACLFCQNYQISQLRQGQIKTIEALARDFVHLQSRGCHNLNWVTPTPQLPMIVKALALASEQGCRLPVVYNTNGYDRREVLQLLDGIVDIYLPDIKYGSDVWAEQFSQLPDYYAVARAAVTEMHRQVGVLQTDKSGIATQGLLVRHLIIPEGTAGSVKVFRLLAGIDPEIPVSVMAQYRPCYRAVGHPVLGRSINRREYNQAVEELELSGLHNVFLQHFDNLSDEDLFFPDFNDTQVFRGNRE